MVFSSATFLFFFLPLTIALYFAALSLSLKAANAVLLFMSLLFYFWGEHEYILLFIGSMTLNYVAAWLLSTVNRESYRRTIFIAGISLNLGLLAFFKYAAFIATNIVALVGIDHAPHALDSIRLPLGISFFTFHGLSYLIDIYRRTIQFRPEKLNLGLYIALFPQLIAGPIVRYKEIFNQFNERTHSWEGFHEGSVRFVLGLGKKMLIANEVGKFADYAFSLPPDRLSTQIAWLGVIAYTLQIYFDFSGYSDMAIGIARMFGFTFPENFRLPYTATSIREFWQRWHITLSNWFRDYLYIPLGGNRGGNLKTMRNLCIVFFLCGLWHGASWNFIVWGLAHGAFLSLERTRFGTALDRAPRAFAHLYTLLVVMLLWIPFRASTLGATGSYWAALFGTGSSALQDPYLVMYFTHRFIVAALVGTIIALGTFNLGAIRKRWDALSAAPKWSAQVAACCALLLLSYAEIAVGSYNPFIYFRF